MTFRVDNTGLIQDAMDNASSGDTVLVYPGTYEENLTVDVENLKIQSTGGAENTIIDASGAMSGVKIENNGVTFEGFTVANPDNYCVWLDPANNNVISNNIVENSYWHGIWVYFSDNNLLNNNICRNTSLYGILLSASDNNRIYYNTCDNNYHGIFLSSSENNIIYHNTCENASGLDGIYLSLSDNNILDNNTCRNNSIGISLSDSDNNRIYHNKCLNNDIVGIYLNLSDTNELSNNTCEDTPGGYGIGLYNSDNNFLFSNKCLTNAHGINIDNNSNNNSIVFNTLENNGHGIYIEENTSTSLVWIAFNNIINNRGNEDSGIHIAKGVDSTKIWVGYNNIVGNSFPGGWSYGLYNLGTGELDAQYNWWGNPSGPGWVGPGTGDNVSDNVNYRPWFPGPFENIVVGWGVGIISEGPNENIEIENVEVDMDSSENGWLMITVLENLGGVPIPENLLRAGMFIDISTFPENIAENIWITIQYTDADVIGIDEENLKLYYWRENENWQLCDNIIIDTANNIITGWIDHLTPFGMFGPPTFTGMARFKLENLYVVSLEEDLWLYQGSKLVVKFYKYWDVFENESVYENFTPPAHVVKFDNVWHPDGVKKAVFVLTTDNTANEISTIASFTVTKSMLFGRYLEIIWEYGRPEADKPALFGEYLNIIIQYSHAPW
jgi:parallel beta-helix repeat protein